MIYFSRLFRRDEKRNEHVRPELKYLIMTKLTMLLIFGLSAGAFASGKAQNITINMSNAALEAVLEEVSKQSDLRLFYDQNIVRDLRINRLNISNASVSSILNKALRGKNLSFQIVNGTIIISEKQQTDRSISGTVRDADGPLQGVTISVENEPGINTRTNAEGHYALRVPDEATLIFRYMGYAEQTIETGQRTTIDVTMLMESAEVEEVVVVGYGTQKKANLTGAVDQIDSKRLATYKATNLGEALAGQVANVNIGISDGKPGRAASFNVRGNTSINGGSPLILLDGVPISSFELNNISPQSIENISILKDASSAAIYGARAAYGVILVTTKEGVAGKPQINYNNNFRWGKATRIPKVYTGLDYLEIQEREFNGNIGQTYYTDPQVQYPYQVAADPSLPMYDLQNIGGKATLLLGGPVINYYEEWFREFTPQQNHNLSLRGGGEKYKYYLSGDFNHEEGNLKFKPEKIDRFNFRANNSFQVSDQLTIFSKSSATMRRDDIPNTYLYGFSSNPWRFIDNTNPLMPETIDIDGQTVPTDIGFYRQFIEKQSEYKTNTSSFLNTFGADLKLLDESLTLHGDVSYLYYHWYRNRWWDNTGPYLSHSFNNRNTVLSHYADAGPAKIYKSNTEQETINVNAYANYKKSLGQHNFDITSGFTYETFKNHYETVAHQDPILGLEEHALNLATGLFEASDDDDKYANRSIFLRTNYNFNEKYLIEVNGMHNLTSKFSRDSRGAFFGSISAGWKISDESFFQPLLPVINSLKIRGSYGALGNQNIGSFDYLSILSMTRSPYLLDGEQYTYTRVPSPKSENFTWETSQTADIGLDATLLDHRMNIVFDYYQRNTNNMLAPYHSLPSVFGATVPKENIASLRNRGWEFTIGWQDQINGTHPLQYGIRANISDYSAVITDYYNPTNYLDDYYVGQRLGDIWGLNTLGFFQSDEEAQNSPLLQTSSYRQFAGAGTIKFEDSNNDGVISRGDWTLADHGDYRIIGNSTPRYQYGINLNFAYRGFDLNAFFKGVGKRDIYPSAETANFWSSYNRKYQVLLQHAVDDRWTPENPNAYFPKPQGYIALGQNDLGVPQTRYLQSASFLRLSNLIVGYNLPRTVLGNTLSQARIYLAGTNLFEWTKLHHTLDPEGLEKDPDANAGSVGMGTAYPIQRTFAFGIEIGF